jgi:hypothetical protein
MTLFLRLRRFGRSRHRAAAIRPTLVLTSLIAVRSTLVLTSLIAVSAAIAVTVTIAFSAVSALRSELTGTIGLSCGEVAATGTVGDVSDRGTSREGCAECEDSACDPPCGDQFLSIDGDRRFDGAFFLNHVRHPFGSCVSHDHCLSHILTFPVRFLCVV